MFKWIRKLQKPVVTIHIFAGCGLTKYNSPEVASTLKLKTRTSEDRLIFNAIINYALARLSFREYTKLSERLSKDQFHYSIKFTDDRCTGPIEIVVDWVDTNRPDDTIGFLVDNIYCADLTDMSYTVYCLLS